MTASSYTFDLTPARRPSLADLGDASKANDLVSPPNPVTDPTAEEWNAFARMLEGLGMMVPVAMVEADMSIGAPFILYARAMRAGVTTANFTAALTAPGNMLISWPAGFLPLPNISPSAYVVGDGSFLQPTVEVPTATQARVRTRNSAGTLVNTRFVLRIY